MNKMHNSDGLPILFENDRIVVFKNPSDEIFIQTKREPVVQMRVHDFVDHLVVTSGNGQGHMEPWSVNGLPAFVIRHP